MKINSVNLFYLIIDKVNGSFEKLTKIALIPKNESKEIMKKCEELWSKIRNLRRLITKNSDDYDEKIHKNHIWFRWRGTSKLKDINSSHNSSYGFLHENNKFYLQVDECLYKSWMLYYDRIDVSEGTDGDKTNESKECYICHYCYFFK